MRTLTQIYEVGYANVRQLYDKGFCSQPQTNRKRPLLSRQDEASLMNKAKSTQALKV